jgi:phosphoglycerol transferase MdoB-like AlkP superfamily enzyme
MIASGHRTTEGMFATLASFQNPLGRSVAKTQLQNFNYNSIVEVLNKKGYNSAFFQGTSKETSGTGSFAQSLGFKLSYGKKDIKKRVYEENYWGVHDSDLYNFVQNKLNDTIDEPFVLGINGATTHDDKIPKGVKKINFTDKKINNLLNTLHFSDFALKKFITNIEEKYPNTIFVVFADHCGGQITDTLDNYKIPFLIYSKKLIKPKYYDTILSQRDIAPTIYDIAIGNYRYSNLSFSGKSLIQDSKFFADYYHNGTLGWIENSDIIEINIATNKMLCFKMDNLNRKKVQCAKIHNILKNHALSFVNISQRLLFDNNILNFISLSHFCK